MEDLLLLPSSKQQQQQEEEQSIPSNRRFKRPRTEKYLEQKAIYEDVLHSCQVFETELAKLSDSKVATRQAIVQSTQQSIQRQTQKYKTKFLSTCQEFKQEAQQTIDLANGFHAMTKAIQQQQQQRPTANILSVLNLGHETTSAVMLRIAEYAGVPSGDHLEDMKLLHLQLQSDLMFQ